MFAVWPAKMATNFEQFSRGIMTKQFFFHYFYHDRQKEFFPVSKVIMDDMRPFALYVQLMPQVVKKIINFKHA